MLLGSRVQAPSSGLLGLVAPQHRASSRMRDGTHVPHVRRQIPTHCATREAPVAGIASKHKFNSKRAQAVQVTGRGRPPQCAVGRRFRAGGAVALWPLHFAAHVMGSVCRMRPTSLTPDLSQSGGARACSEEPARTSSRHHCWGRWSQAAYGWHLDMRSSRRRVTVAIFVTVVKHSSRWSLPLSLSARFCRAAATAVPRALSSTPKPCLH